MPFTTLITVSELNVHIGDGNWAVVDCRYSLDDTERGRRDYLEAHIPGAVYAHMDNDLSGTKIPGKTGRHPLPDTRSFIATASSLGIDSNTQVVVYDDASGAMAARLWWLLNWMGHRSVAVLDGGWLPWHQSGLPSRSGPEYRIPKRFEAHEIPDSYATTEQVETYASDPHYVILDARSAPRFRGEIEPIDPVAGHIPGAISAPYEENLTPDGRFLPADALRRRFEGLMKSVSPGNVICYCGSGITSALNLVAIAHAGLGRARLYAGSWSEWIADNTRPVATGVGPGIV